jgi:hypothetical protein
MFRTVLVMTTAALIFVGKPAAAQQLACTERGEVVSHLSSEYSEEPVAMGLANNGGVVEILSNKNGKSWTIILTMPNGVSCMIAAGESWESLPQLVTADPAA